MNKDVATGSSNKVCAGDPQSVSVLQHKDGSRRKKLHFKCNHCSGIFKKLELRNQRDTVQHKSKNENVNVQDIVRKQKESIPIYFF